MERRANWGRKGGVPENNKTILASVVTTHVSTPEVVFGGTDARRVSKRVSKEVNVVLSLYIQRTSSLA